MRGRIRRRGKNSWELTVDLGRDPQGKRLSPHFPDQPRGCVVIR